MSKSSLLKTGYLTPALEIQMTIEESPSLRFNEGEKAFDGFQCVDACYQTTLRGYRYKKLWR